MITERQSAHPSGQADFTPTPNHDDSDAMSGSLLNDNLPDTATNTFHDPNVPNITETRPNQAVISSCELPMSSDVLVSRPTRVTRNTNPIYTISERPIRDQRLPSCLFLHGLCCPAHMNIAFNRSYFLLLCLPYSYNLSCCVPSIHQFVPLSILRANYIGSAAVFVFLILFAQNCLNAAEAPSPGR